MKSQTNRLFRTCATLFLTGAALMINACGTPVPAPQETSTTIPALPDTQRVFFSEPADGATVSSPFLVKMAAENFVVETTENGINAGKGHLHIIVDADCIAVGNGIPKDDTHLHYGKGQLEAELTLTPGEHTLCLQAADGAHIALEGEGMTHVIKLNVK